MKETLEYLKTKYRIGVISDMNPSIKRVLRNTGIYDYFDNLTLSYEIGVSKPSSKIFEYALEAMNLPAVETVFIDDHEKNLNGAATKGIQSILINSRPNSKESARFKALS